MTTQPFKQEKINILYIYENIRRDPVFLISFALALTSCAFNRPRLDYINFEVLACLFNLMLVVKAFEGLKVLDWFAVGIINRCTDSRKVSLVMIMLSFFSSMLITNDIALLTLVPLTLIISRRSDMNVLLTVILQTLAANIGSSLTPVGNPQNLYIFSYYSLTAKQFFAPIALFAGLGLVWLYVLNFRNPENELNMELKPVKIRDGRKALIWSMLFALIVSSVFGLISYKTALLVTSAVAIVLDRGLFKKVDYHLLATFVCFFIFIGNVSDIPSIAGFVASYLDSPVNTYFGSIILSQIVSNVPSAVFLSRFTECWRELLLGVNIGGMGTIIASLASVISYKLFTGENPESSGRYMLKFSVYNLISLLFFTSVNYFLVVQ